MLEFLKNALDEVKEALVSNGEHRVSLASFVTAAHDAIAAVEARVSVLEAAAQPVAELFGAGDKVAALESRVSAVESSVTNGFASIQPLAAAVDAVTGAGAQVAALADRVSAVESTVAANIAKQ